MGWLDALGWAGSALLVYSLLQSRVLRLRVLNLVACLVLVVFNAAIGVWPMAAMNTALAAINVWFIRKMLVQRHDDRAYQVLEVGADEAYLRHVLAAHDADIRRFFPHYPPDGAHPPGERHRAYLVQHGDRTAGVVLVDDAGDGVARVSVDYVTPPYRDFSPGEFVYRRSGLFRDAGFRRVLTPPGMVRPYYDRLGFRREGDRYALELGGGDPAA